MRQKLTLVTLGVTDLETFLKFYRDDLGCKPSGANQGDVVFFDLDGIGLSLYPRNLLAEDVTVSAEGIGFSVLL